MELYQDVFVSYCTSTDRLDLLAQCYFTEESHVMPSWVPDWRAHPRLYRRPDVEWQSAGMSQADIHVLHKSKLLVTGLLKSSVVNVHEPARENDYSSRSLHILLTQAQPAMYDGSPYVTGEDMLEDRTTTLAVGAYKERTPFAGCDSLKIWQKKIR